MKDRYKVRWGYAVAGHFWERLLRELGVGEDRRDLGRVFVPRSAERWERRAAEHDLPLVAVKDVEQGGISFSPE